MTLQRRNKYLKYLLRAFRHHFRSDKCYRVKKFKSDFGYSPDLSTPKTFNEKILCRMINREQNERFTQLADKLTVREHVEQSHRDILPVIHGVFDSVNEIDTFDFPDRFVLKCNHDSGSYVICTDRKQLNVQEAKAKLSCHLKMNMYYKTREWQYKRIKPKIFC